MKNLFYRTFVVLCLLLSAITYAQKDYGNAIKGSVIDKSTNKPLAGVAVFLSQTSYFSLTDANGNFEIKNILPGNYQVVFNMKNYLTMISNLYAEKGNQFPLSISMEPLPAEEIAKFNAPKSSDFDSDYMKFERIFIGQTAYMGSCKVQNPEVMKFKWDKDVITGNSNGPIIFVHSKFGYKLHCVINNFVYDTKQLSRGLDFVVYFEEMKPEDSDELDDWKDYREEAYIGSINHFLWALRNDKLQDEDYELFVLRSLGTEAFSSDGMDAASDASSQFQNKILKFSEVNLGPIDDNQILFTINGFWKVVHKPRSYSKETSFLQVPSQASMSIDKEGFTDLEMPFTCYGLWGKNGISNLLPKEYRGKK